jgi:ERCC4-type nuclease
MTKIKEEIIVDTRERLPIFKGKGVILRKLEEGDYSTPFLEDKVVIERKSPIDLYGSIVQGHIRFADEIMRTRLLDKKMYVVVECEKDTFISKRFHGAYFLKLRPPILVSIISAIEAKYFVIFVWCKNRQDVKNKILDIIKINNKLYNKP